jgi:CDP-glucose 4,6-dehydratase
MTIDKHFWKNKRILITGHTGFKGSWLYLLLDRLGSRVSGYALEPPTNPSMFELGKIGELGNSQIGDIRENKKLLGFIQSVKPEIIFHLAAQPLVRESYKNPVETYEINVMGTVNLLEAVRQTNGVKAVVNVTSDKCYENKEWSWGYRENEPMGGYDPYSNSKGCSELVTSAYRNSYFNSKDYHLHGVALASARAGNVIGGGDWAEDRLIPDFMRAINLGKELKIRSPLAIRPWQHVLESLSGYLMLAERLYTFGPEYAKPWNFGPDDNDAKNVEWIVNRFSELWGEGFSYSIDSTSQLHEATYLKLDCSKAKDRLGWKPVWNLDQALYFTVQWYHAWFDKKDMRKVTENQISKYIM